MLLQGIEGVSVYVDDILVTGSTIEEHLRTLEEVLKRLEAANLRLNRDKCFFLRPSIEYLGYIIDKDEVHPTEAKVRAISSKTIEKLRITFANYGLPRKVVTDNGSSFTSEEFRTFMSENGIVHITSAPYHPSSNGLAERAVQTFKNGIKRT